ncbi:MAG: hypothetical protein IT339_09150 [Thermomicrobiales bacterium]|nr:hypothetical protein [Thermomicrobiales bacterium]
MEQAPSGLGSRYPANAPAIFADVIAHLCEGDCHAFGDLIEWCESRRDCTIAVVCPSCSHQWVIDDEELAALERWTNVNGSNFGCGIHIEA